MVSILQRALCVLQNSDRLKWNCQSESEMVSQNMYDGAVITQLVFTGIGLIGSHLAWSVLRDNATHTREQVSQPESIDTLPGHTRPLLALPMVFHGRDFAFDFFGYPWFLELLGVKFRR